MNTPDKIITHHAVSAKSHTAQDVDDWHKVRWPGFTSEVFKNDRGYFYHVGYHYVIEWGGKVVQTRDETEEGAHTIGQNSTSIGICFMGNFDEHLPSPQQMDAFKTLYKRIISRHKITLCVPHRKYANKSCHGALLSDDYFLKFASDNSAEISRLTTLLKMWKELLVLIKSRK